MYAELQTGAGISYNEKPSRGEGLNLWMDPEADALTARLRSPSRGVAVDSGITHPRGLDYGQRTNGATVFPLFHRTKVTKRINDHFNFLPELAPKHLSQNYLGHPVDGFFLDMDFFTASCHFPSIFRVSGFGPVLALGCFAALGMVWRGLIRQPLPLC